MGLPGAKPKADRSQVRHRVPVAEWTEVANVPFTDAPPLPARDGRRDWAAVADNGVVPGIDWPDSTKRWYGVVSKMPHAKLWEPGDWEFVYATAEVHARTQEGWKGFTGGELRQREKLLGLYADARRDLRIRYVDALPDAEPASITNLADYRAL